MFYSKIAVAYDGSVLSEKALSKAIQAAQADASVQLHVLHVVNPRLSTGALSAYAGGEWYDGELRRGEELVKTVRRRLLDLPNPSSVILITGDPGNEILRFAKEKDCDLIMIGSRGLTGLKELILGSVSHYVAQHAEVPVLIVK